MGGLLLLGDAYDVVILVAAHPEVMRLHRALAAHFDLYTLELGRVCHVNQDKIPGYAEAFAIGCECVLYLLDHGSPRVFVIPDKK
jgi:hypothetical protein